MAPETWTSLGALDYPRTPSKCQLCCSSEPTRTFSGHHFVPWPMNTGCNVDPSSRIVHRRARTENFFEIPSTRIITRKQTGSEYIRSREEPRLERFSLSRSYIFLMKLEKEIGSSQSCEWGRAVCRAQRLLSETVVVPLLPSEADSKNSSDYQLAPSLGCLIIKV